MSVQRRTPRHRPLDDMLDRVRQSSTDKRRSQENVNDGEGPTPDFSFHDLGAESDGHAGVDGVEEGLGEGPVVEFGVEECSQGEP
mmetsp:Transcript_12764/g.25945  ORF Transcript_12764/g.25945 Transcript_12764/m.25945 type:complete len:85 (-) Transcript_12764:656-910(-)